MPYKGRIGFYNIFAWSRIQQLYYQAADLPYANGFWAMFIEPTALGEGLNFLTLNTDDQAARSVSGQFAGHASNSHLVTYCPAMLALPGSYTDQILERWWS
ncbi:hypothetical protein [Sinorhizobium sp. 8-89]|uniref:hypothetical protein n=1 Tax=Sinorhizobium sp. 8-89 TaxID=3049089 RepID=UPI0024C38E40|nr:hypothetical protein [Sinorhizobium sp. 8-89]